MSDLDMGTPRDLNLLTIAGTITRKPAYSQKRNAMTLTLRNSRTHDENNFVVYLDHSIANAAVVRICAGHHVTFTAHLDGREVDGKTFMALIATDYAINNTHAGVREAGHGDGAEEFEHPNRPISERYATRSWDARQPDFGE